MTVHLHTAERTDALADGLADLLVTPLPDPFAREVVVVPARGVERWLTQRLSHRLGVGPRGGDGVCAGVDFVTPHSLVVDAARQGRRRPVGSRPARLAAAGRHRRRHGRPPASTTSPPTSAAATRRRPLAPAATPWPAAWPACSPPTPCSARSSSPDWRAGLDTDGAGGELDPDLRWQAELWRRLLGRVGAPPPDVRLADTLARLRAGGDDLDLPPRLSLFGHTRLPETEVALLRALGEVREVHLWLPQASPVALGRAGADRPRGPGRRGPPTARPSVVGHPAARLARTRLARAAPHARRRPAAAAPTCARMPDTLLGWLQHDLRANTRPTPRRRSRPHDRDDSVQVHACHGAARQVDVLREVLVGLLQDDPTLEPRDILVMCPDIETYAPLISAAFGMADVAVEAAGHPGHQLRVRLADRSLAATNPLLGRRRPAVELVARPDDGQPGARRGRRRAGARSLRLRRRRAGAHRPLGRRRGHPLGLRRRPPRHLRARRRLGQHLGGRACDRVLLGAAMSGLDHRQVVRHRSPSTT